MSWLTVAVLDLLVDVERGVGACLPLAVVGHTRVDGVVALRLHRFDPQHRQVGHFGNQVSIPASIYTFSSFLPVKWWRWISRRLAEETHFGLFCNFLTFRCQSNSWWTWKKQTKKYRIMDKSYMLDNIKSINSATLKQKSRKCIFDGHI